MSDEVLRGGLSRRISVSVYGKSISELTINIGRALSSDPGYIELRLDYLRSIVGNISRLENLKLFPNGIFTFRARAEGGVSRVSDETREGIILEIISKIFPPIIDIEIQTLSARPEIFNSLESKNTKLIASSHDFQKTESLHELETLVLKAVKHYSPSVVKVVRKANEFDDNLRMLSLYSLAEEIKPTRLVAFCSGALGVFSRIACVSYGSPFTFASLPGLGTAAGQLDVDSMKTILDSLSVNQK
jgi:3-dehydroquinate dehydratase-1